MGHPTIGGLPSPVFYPSVSSVSKNTWTILDHIELLVSFNHPQFLVSALDIYKHQNNKQLISALKRADRQNQVVLYDSGIYEVVWGKNRKWCRKRYVKTLKRNKFSHAFDFDLYCTEQKKNISDHITKSVRSTVGQLKRHAISPILHGSSVEEFVDSGIRVSNSLAPKVIAIPERELGKGILEITANIKSIRNAFNALGVYQTIHILGTGNPLSMLAYYFAGADSFDGLDWCQTVVDFETGTLHHPLHLDLYKHQSEYGAEESLSFHTRCYLHNLEFYSTWTDKLQSIQTPEAMDDLLQQYFDGTCYDMLSNILVSHSKLSESNEALAS